MGGVLPDNGGMAERREHPVLAGLLALVGVGLAVGLVLGGAVLAGTEVLGLGGGTSTQSATAQQSMFLPKPEPTQASSTPDGVATGSAIGSATPSATPSAPSPTEQPSTPSNEISLSASQTAVTAMGQIDLTGTYPGGEGSILQVQRFTGGSWQDFPVTASVSDGTFATYVQTGQLGVNRFRVADSATGELSNEVRVTVG